jgi:hypothetical protein
MRKKTEIEEIIRGILGKDKFLMVNMKLVKELTPNGALFLTYLLDKLEYLVKSKAIDETDGFYVFRRDFVEKLSLSHYQQRNIERDLEFRGLLKVDEERVKGETFNRYYLNLNNIFDLVDKEQEKCST